jgi:hypothetical protein
MDGPLLQIIHKEELLDERFPFRKIVELLPRRIDYKQKQVFFLFFKIKIEIGDILPKLKFEISKMTCF